MLLSQQGNRLSRRELLQTHEDHANRARHIQESHSIEINTTYPESLLHSSKAQLGSLMRITLSELKLETVHYGYVLVCRTIVKPFKFKGVHLVVEDPITGHGPRSARQVKADRLSLYDFVSFPGSCSDLSEVVPLGTRLFIKEPYYKIGSQDGVPTIRCDSPADVIFVPNEQIDGPLLAGLQWTDTLSVTYGPTVKCGPEPCIKSADDLKRKGNEQFTRKDYVSAINTYTQALGLEPRNDLLLSNRAQAYLNLNQFHKAQDDAEEAWNVSKTNIKARFRQAKALYGMKLYEKASAILKDLKTSTEIQQLLQSIQQRLEEQQHGRYDIKGIIEESRSIHYLDHADYVGHVRVTDIPGKGRGMMATENIVEGTLLLCSKAFAIVFEDEREKHVEIPTNASIVSRIVCKLQNEPLATADIYNLYAGPNMPPIPVNRTNTTENILLDINRITNIVDQNCLELRSDDHLWSQPFLPHAFGTGSRDKTKIGNEAGLWIMPSFINHSCLANASYITIGDLMFVRAMRAIAKDEEILISYLSIGGTCGERKEKLQLCGFECKCPLCESERTQPRALRNRRAQLLSTFEGFRSAILTGDSAMIPRLTGIIRELRETYPLPPSATANRARSRRGKKNKKKPTFSAHQLQVDLLPPLSGLFSILVHCGNLEQAIKVLVEMFEIAPRCGGIGYTRMNTAMTFAFTYNKMKRLDETNHWVEVARKERELTYGEGEGIGVWQEKINSILNSERK
ncbi:hypothetical protein BC937DRAFT_94090 [Endogone sp. FLAS-F59071]|nr:hypothetical protein BC937DRAFT_94090 [Endogone sp. FLAS-F59071]|eukprot:RUS20899.1 hypothetical protein BC937DRAFT_94090 [Endogone sp. FLAS-F59071]